MDKIADLNFAKNETAPRTEVLGAVKLAPPTRLWAGRSCGMRMEITAYGTLL